MNSVSCIQGSGSPLVVTHKRRKIEVTRKHNAGAGVSVKSQGSPLQSAVYVRDLCKRYGSSHILRNFCMDVRKGTIYGLLGASGCGKTTVLSTLVGIKKCDSGEVVVLGQPPGKMGRMLGYVPQEMALYDQLSIREIIGFYGCMYNMTSDELTDRFNFLTKLLDLPSDFRLIGTMSGGQRRRVSLAVALIHCPSLLVLDEPTVGLDPLLRRSIWNHMYKIVSTLNTTVIITTHYIEEARLANTVGLMRGGRLIAQDSPTSLLHTFQCTLLEEVVLKLCRKDHQKPTREEEGSAFKITSNWKQDVSSTLSIDFDELADGIFRKAVGFDCEMHDNFLPKGSNKASSHGSKLIKHLRNSAVFQSLQRIGALTTVLVMTYLRHPVFIGLILLMPAIHGTITCITIGAKPVGLNFGIVNKELMNWTTECGIRGTSSSCDLSALSCFVINQLKRRTMFHLMPYNNEDSALEEVEGGRAWGYLIFEENYSQHTVERLVVKKFATNESLEGSQIRMRMDHSHYVTAFFVVKEVYAAFLDAMQTFASACEINGREVALPLNFRPPVYGHYKDNYIEFMAPGALVCCLLAILSVLTSVTFITHKREGTLSRAQVAGLQMKEVVISHIVTQTLIAIIQAFLWTAIPYIFVDFAIMGSIPLYVFLIVLTGLCGIIIGIFMGIVFSTEAGCLLFGFCCLPIFILFGGALYPLEYAMPYCKEIGLFLPVTMPIISLRSVINRGMGVTHDLVWSGIAVSFVWIVFILILSVIAQKRKL